MIRIRSTSNVVTLGKKEGAKSSSKTSSAGETLSPFAAHPADALKSLTDRKSRPLTEEKKLALLQGAFKTFSLEARSHLPSPIRKVEKKVRKKMIEEGFSTEVASEAGDEAVSALLS